MSNRTTKEQYEPHAPLPEVHYPTLHLPQPLQALSNVIELKPERKYLLVFKGEGFEQFELEELVTSLRSHGMQGLGIVLATGQELEVIEVPNEESQG